MKRNEIRKNAVISAIFLLLLIGGRQTILRGGNNCENPMTLRVDSIVNIPMAYVKGGTFTMSRGKTKQYDVEDEKTARRVTLPDYLIGKFEVTQSEWVAVMDSNPSYFRGGNLPVDNVNWFDAQEFIKKLNELTGKHFRLPSEAEWEFAARGGNKTHDYDYSGSNNPDKVAWYSDDNDETHPVGTKLPNELGIYDMSGNVWEWCNDRYVDSRTDLDGTTMEAYHIYKDANWSDSDAQISSRGYSTPYYHDNAIGFRLAQDIK